MTIAVLLFTLLSSPVAHAAEKCELQQLVEVPITMDGRRPTIEAAINGQPATLVLDSGAFWSFLPASTAAQYGLSVDYNRAMGLDIRGVGGRIEYGLTSVKTLTVFGVPVRNVDFLVGGSNPGAHTAGILGQNLLRLADLEYQLGVGKLRLIRPNHCSYRDVLAYWMDPGDAYSVMDTEETTVAQPLTVGHAVLNGTRVRVVFDTGATFSFVGLRAAAAAGMKPGDPRLEAAGESAGLGRRSVQTWLATFPVLKIGDEEVHNARLRVADLGEVDMLLGEDFFLSHRVYVANSQHKIYFTYSGGAVFAPIGKSGANDVLPRPSANGEKKPNEPIPSGASDSVPGIGSAPLANKSPGALTDAQEWARQAAAQISRGGYDGALQDIDRAIEVFPGSAPFYLLRAQLEQRLGKEDSAAQDLDKVIGLDPRNADAILLRARYRLQTDKAAARADLDSVDRLEPKEAYVRLSLAELYLSVAQPSQAIAQLDLWIAVHDHDRLLAQGYNLRCWGRAMQGIELGKALSDCTAALRLDPTAAAILDSRGLVNLRMDHYHEAIADYDAALKEDPRRAMSLYGRGVAELRTGLKAKGEHDIAAAATIDPGVAELAQKMSIAP